MDMNNNVDITLCSFAFTQRLCLDGTSAGAEDEMWH